MASKPLCNEQLEELRKRIEQWRQTRLKRGRMPEQLWFEAAEFARRLGPCPVSRALGIGYRSLQQRIGGPRRSRPATARRAPMQTAGFVELSGAQLLDAAAAAPSGGATVEIAAGDGARLMVRLPAAAAVDLASVIRAFRG